MTTHAHADVETAPKIASSLPGVGMPATMPPADRSHTACPRRVTARKYASKMGGVGMRHAILKKLFATQPSRPMRSDVAKLCLILGIIATAVREPCDAAEVSGQWEGTLTTGNGWEKVEVVFRLRLAQERGSWSGTIYSPRWGREPWPLQELRVDEAGVLRFQVRSLEGGRTGSFTGRFVKTSINAEYEFGGAKYEGTFGRDKSPMLEKAVDALIPTGPFPYRTESVTFRAGGTIEQTGGLVIPKGPGPHPAIVLLSGSTQESWDAGVPGDLHPRIWSWLVADHLARNGVAVMRLDDRGVAGTGGDFDETTLDELAVDARSAMKYLASRDDISRNKIGILGYSQGAEIAMIAARMSPEDINWLVLVGAPGLRGDQVLLEQRRALLHALGFDAEIDAALQAQKHLFELALGDKPADDVIAEMKTWYSDFYAGLQRAGKKGTTPTEMESSVKNAMGRRNRSIIRWDPADTLRHIRTPVLILHGEDDIAVSAKQNVPALLAGLKAAKNQAVEVEVFKGLDHDLGRLDKEQAIAPIALDRISRWVTGHQK